LVIIFGVLFIKNSEKNCGTKKICKLTFCFSNYWLKAEDLPEKELYFILINTVAKDSLAITMTFKK